MIEQSKKNTEVLKEVNKIVYGHLSVKKTLINLINRSKIRYLQMFKYNLPVDKCLKRQNCLLIGASGTGKTMLVNTLAKIMSFPFLSFDLSQLNNIGYTGGGITSITIVDMILKYVKSLQEQPSLDYCSFSEKGILAQLVVFFDEIDKLTINCSSGNWTYKQQSEILNIFEGNNKIPDINIITAGAFTSLTMNNKPKLDIGFMQNSQPSESLSTDLTNKLLKVGLCPELLGRINIVSQMDVFTKDDYANVYDEWLYPKFIKELSKLGINEFSITAVERDTMIKNIMSYKLGIRGISNYLSKLSAELEWDADILYNYKGECLEEITVPYETGIMSYEAEFLLQKIDTDDE